MPVYDNSRDVRQTTRELRAIVIEADPTWQRGHLFHKEYEFSNGKQIIANYQKRGPYDPTQNVEEELQEVADRWPSYESADYFGGPNDE